MHDAVETKCDELVPLVVRSTDVVHTSLPWFPFFAAGYT